MALQFTVAKRNACFWPPAESLVILYRQNGEEFERAHLGNIESGVELFETTGSTCVTFELQNKIE